MNDMPKTITIDLTDKPVLAAMLHALYVSHCERHAQVEAAFKAQQEYDAQFDGLSCEDAEKKRLELCASGTLLPRPHHPHPHGRIPARMPPKMTLDGLALCLLQGGATMALRANHLRPQHGPTDLALGAAPGIEFEPLY